MAGEEVEKFDLAPVSYTHLTIVFAVDNFLRICGKTRESMFLNIFMSILSVALEAFFLLVLRLGIAGAALGTCLGMAVKMCIRDRCDCVDEPEGDVM